MIFSPVCFFSATDKIFIHKPQKNQTTDEYILHFFMRIANLSMRIGEVYSGKDKLKLSDDKLSKKDFYDSNISLMPKIHQCAIIKAPIAKRQSSQ